MIPWSRVAGKDDIGHVTGLITSAITERYGPNRSVALATATISTLRNEIRDIGGALIVGGTEASSKPCGFVFLLRRSPVCDAGLTAVTLMTLGSDRAISKGAVESLWVFPKFRRHGVAGCMMDFVIALSRRYGIDRLDLLLEKDNANAQRIYLRRGFRQI